MKLNNAPGRSTSFEQMLFGLDEINLQNDQKVIIQSLDEEQN